MLALLYSIHGCCWAGADTRTKVLSEDGAHLRVGDSRKQSEQRRGSRAAGCGRRAGRVRRVRVRRFDRQFRCQGLQCDTRHATRMKIVVKWPVTGLPVVRSHPMERAHAEDEELYFLAQDEELYFLCTCSDSFWPRRAIELIHESSAGAVFDCHVHQCPRSLSLYRVIGIIISSNWHTCELNARGERCFM